MKLRIVSDGTPLGTHIVNAETGERIENVLGVQWEINGRQTARAIIEVKDVPVDLRVDAQIRLTDTMGG